MVKCGHMQVLLGLKDSHQKDAGNSVKPILINNKVMSYKLFLDDVRRPATAYSYMELPILLEPDWIIVRNYYAFISIIQKKGVPNVIAFDHDLADIHYKVQSFNYEDENYEKTGYHCAKWLLDYCLDNNEKPPQRIIIHSMNPYGSANIKSLFDTYYKIHGTGLPDISENNPVLDINPYLRI